MLIFGKGLDSPIAIPARNRKQNSSDLIINEIDKLEMSDKKITLLSNPIRIIITTITPPKGKGNNKTVKFIENNEKGRIKIINNDKYCLLYAAEIARIHADCTTKSGKNKFSTVNKLMKNAKKQQELVQALIKESEIKINENGCGLKELDFLQDFYDKKYPNKYRLILFEAENVYLKPLWKGPRPRFHHLILYLENQHFDVIKKIPLFFNLKRKFCLDCEIPYSRLAFYFFLTIFISVINIIEKIVSLDVTCVQMSQIFLYA
jgi:hypothetical protein